MSANLSAVPKLQFFDNNGNPLVGGKLYTYAAGTTTPQATFTDASATTPNTNPIILDSRGEANVWLSATTYKFVLKDASDATIWTVDNISNSLSLSQILAASGSAASPPYTFASDTDTGVYLAAVGQLGLSVGGVPVIRSTSTILTIGQSGGADDVDVTHFGDTAQTGNVIQTGNWTLTGDVNVTGAAVFNEAGADKDFRVEGDTDVNLLFVDASTDRVGIGTSSPGYTLDINKASADFRVRNATGGNDFVVRSIAGPTTVIGSMSNTPLAITTNDITRIHITSTGNVGVGTTNPQTKLHVDNGATDEVARFEGTGSPFISLYDSGTREFFIQTAAEINIWGQANKAMSFATNNIVRAQIAADGSQSSVIPNGSTLYPQFACRAWINFDGTAVTNPASTTGIRGSGNVSSVLDNGTGDYTINFTTAMPDTNYAVTGVAKEYDSTTGSTVVFYLAEQTIANTLSTSFVRVHTATGGASTATDAVVVCVAVFR